MCSKIVFVLLAHQRKITFIVAKSYEIERRCDILLYKCEARKSCLIKRKEVKTF